MSVQTISNNLDKFFANHERRAFKIAYISVRDTDTALDIVQEAMTKLISNYSQKPEQEWTPLFFRILQNCIIDFHRHNSKTRYNVRHDDDQIDSDALHFDFLQHNSPSSERLLDNANFTYALECAIQQLPEKQQQCFLLRCLQGLSIEQTAEIMSCTKGSVKQHYFRALKRLQKILQNYAPETRSKSSALS